MIKLNKEGALGELGAKGLSSSGAKEQLCSPKKTINDYIIKMLHR